jgi:hypothetical protein
MKTEDRIQQECYMWFWNTYPELRKLLFAVPNGRYRNVIDAVILNKTGLVAGVSDMIFLYKGGAYLFELKTETGVQSDAQKEWEKIVNKQGFNYYIIRDLIEFSKVIVGIINNN